METRECKKCEETKPIERFKWVYGHKSKKNPKKKYHLYTCRKCHNKEYNWKKYHNPITKREYMYKKRYGITVNDYNEMLISQDGMCAICKTDKKIKGYFHVDHCHDTKKIRGLLCIRCNAGIGYFKDNILNLEKAIVYLKNSTRKLITK